MNKQINNFNKGFTLVELLVVIAILAILTTIGMVQYSGLNAKARDSGRRADLYEIGTALEVHKTQAGYIPLQMNQFSSFQWVDPSGHAYCIAPGSPADPADTTPWKSNCPAGFSAVAPGVPSGNPLKWKLCTYLEKPTSGQSNVLCKISSQ